VGILYTLPWQRRKSSSASSWRELIGAGKLLEKFGPILSGTMVPIYLDSQVAAMSARRDLYGGEAAAQRRERVCCLLVLFSNLYTVVDTPARGRVGSSTDSRARPAFRGGATDRCAGVPRPPPGGVGPSGARRDLYGGAAAAQRRADSRARPAFRGGCHGPKGGAPLPAGGARGSPDPPGGGWAL
jgi:hypothetical protein